MSQNPSPPFLPPRSLKSFGLAGILGEESKIFFTTCFSSKGIGRASDLISTQVPKTNSEELRIRILLLITAFEGLQYQTPIQIECGSDGTYFGVGLSFSIAPNQKLDLAKTKLALSQCRPYADSIWVKMQPSQGKYEIVARTLNDRPLDGSLGQVDFVMIDSTVEETPKHQQVTELGDIDYESALREEFKTGRPSVNLSGKTVISALGIDKPDKIVVPGNRAPVPAEAVLVAAQIEEKVQEEIEARESKGILGKLRGLFNKVTGKENSATDKNKSKKTKLAKGLNQVRVKGTTTHISDDKYLIPGESEIDSQEETIEQELDTELDQENGDFSPDSETNSSESSNQSRDLQKTTRRFRKSTKKPDSEIGNQEMDLNSMSELSDSDVESETEHADDENDTVHEIENKPRRSKKIDLVNQEKIIIPGEETSNSNGPKGKTPEGNENTPKKPESDIQRLLREAREMKDQVKDISESTIETRKKAFDQAVATKRAEIQASQATTNQLDQTHTENAKFSKSDNNQRDYSASETSGESEPKKSNSQSIERSDPNLKGVGADKTVFKSATPSNAPDITIPNNDASRSVEQGKLNDVIKHFQAGPPANPEEAKKWADGMMKEVVAEKARIAEEIKKMEILVKQKELEFTSKERGLQEEVRKREETIRQKEAAITHQKEQNAQLTANFEKLKKASGSSSKEAFFKNKLSETETQLRRAKEEKEAAQKQVDELKRKVSESGSAAPDKKEKGALGAVEAQAMKTNLDRAARQTEELKRVNKQLMDKVAALEKKKASGGTQVEEMKGRLQTAVKQAEDRKKEIEKLEAEIKKLKSSGKAA